MATILVIEDSAPLRESIAEALEFCDYQVIQAEDGKQGLQRTRESHPDLLLCDIMMPGLDGLEVHRHLRADPLTADIPIIFLTARTDQRQAVEALGPRVDFVVKPFQLPDLLTKVRTHLDTSQH
ncbi:MAG TPA: response regulator [Aggregatilineales bacterium]|nr:response regulator [Aggregatilineales bacterium]